MSLETSNVETDLIDEPLPFIPKLIPLQSLSNHVKKDGVAIPLSNPSAPSAIPSAIVLEETVLPNGWKRVVKQRQSGKSAGSTDAYVFTPSGQRLRSRREMERYIEKTGDTSASLDIFKFGRTRGKVIIEILLLNIVIDFSLSYSLPVYLNTQFVLSKFSCSIKSAICI
jgi:hypothetical protein